MWHAIITQIRLIIACKKIRDITLCEFEELKYFEIQCYLISFQLLLDYTAPGKNLGKKKRLKRIYLKTMYENYIFISIRLN